MQKEQKVQVLKTQKKKRCLPIRMVEVVRSNRDYPSRDIRVRVEGQSIRHIVQPAIDAFALVGLARVGGVLFGKACKHLVRCRRFVRRHHRVFNQGSCLCQHIGRLCQWHRLHGCHIEVVAVGVVVQGIRVIVVERGGVAIVGIVVVVASYPTISLGLSNWLLLEWEW